MEKYIGIKVVEAEPCTRTFDEDGRQVEVAGYNVTYKDGYKSWSPAAPFEEASRKNGELSFSMALYMARQGKKISRKGWNGKGQYITVATHFEYDDSTGHNKADHKTSHSAALVFHGTLGDQVGWLASQSDMLSDDWCVLED